MKDRILKYLSARVGNQWYGIEVEQVIEVLHLVAYNEVPSPQDDVLGLITVRAEVMPLVDLRRRFGLKETQLKLDTPVIAIRSDSGPLALVFDDADRVEEFSESVVTTSKDSRQLRYVSGVARLADRLLFLLDANSLAQQNESLPPDATGRKGKRRTTRK
jgi:purine-binding chemotaxis protein CheW